MLFFDRKPVIDCFQEETVNYISRKVIDSFISIEKHEVSKRRTRYTNEHQHKEGLFFVVLLNKCFFSKISNTIKNDEDWFDKSHKKGYPFLKAKLCRFH